MPPSATLPASGATPARTTTLSEAACAKEECHPRARRLGCAHLEGSSGSTITVHLLMGPTRFWHHACQVQFFVFLFLNEQKNTVISSVEQSHKYKTNISSQLSSNARKNRISCAPALHYAHHLRKRPLRESSSLLLRTDARNENCYL